MGRAFVFGDNVDTDAIIPANRMVSSDPTDLATGAMAGIDSSFASQVTDGDVLVAGTNFGCGSSREHAPVALKATGIDAVVAESFARIFFRNSVNIGLPVLQVRESTEVVSQGDELTVDTASGTINNETTGQTHQAAGLPPFAQDIVATGGLIEYGQRRLEGESTDTHS